MHLAIDEAFDDEAQDVMPLRFGREFQKVFLRLSELDTGRCEGFRFGHVRAPWNEEMLVVL